MIRKRNVATSKCIRSLEFELVTINQEKLVYLTKLRATAAHLDKVKTAFKENFKSFKYDTRMLTRLSVVNYFCDISLRGTAFADIIRSLPGHIVDNSQQTSILKYNVYQMSNKLNAIQSQYLDVNILHTYSFI